MERVRWMASNLHWTVHMPQPRHLFVSTTLRPQLRQRLASLLICSSVKIRRSSLIVRTFALSTPLTLRAGFLYASTGRTRSSLLSGVKWRVLRWIVSDWPSLTKRCRDTAPSRPMASASTTNFWPETASPPAKISGSPVWSVTGSAMAVPLRLNSTFVPLSSSFHSTFWPMQ